jgi:hypothetical protein
MADDPHEDIGYADAGHKARDYGNDLEDVGQSATELLGYLRFSFDTKNLGVCEFTNFKARRKCRPRSHSLNSKVGPR